MIRLRLCVLLTLFASSGCAGGLQSGWAPKELLVVPETTDYEDTAAVMLLDELTVRYVELPMDLYQERRVHRVAAVLTEDGLDVGDIRILYPKKGEIRSFEARTISPDGSIAEVEPTKVFDEDSESKDGYSVRTASLPRVAVGSIVEYTFVVRYPRPYSADWDTISGDYPIKKYRVQFTGPKSYAWQAQAYNFPDDTKGWIVEQKGRQWSLSIELDDVPARVNESYDVHGWDSEPRWSFIIRQYRDGSRVYNWNYDWRYALEGRGKQLYFDSSDWYRDFSPDIDVDDCKAIACKVDRCLAWLNENVELLGFGSFPGRPAKEVLDAKVGYGVERNRMLYRMLADLDIESYFVFHRTRHDGQLDENIPIAGSLNHMILWLPEQAGLSEPMFVDGTCEWCDPGQLPGWSLGQKGARIRPKPDRIEDTIELEWTKIEGEPAPAEKFGYRLKARLDESGNLRGHLEKYGLNRAAHSIRSDTHDWDEDDWKKSSRNLVKDRASTIEVSSYDRYQRIPIRRAQRSVQFNAPAYGVVDGERLLIPLTSLDMGWDDRFVESISQREHDLRFSYSYHAVEEFEVEIPTGYTIERLPEPVRAGSSPLKISARFEKTPTGFRVVRSVKVDHGVYDKETFYPRVSEALDAFRSVRTETVVALKARP